MPAFKTGRFRPRYESIPLAGIISAPLIAAADANAAMSRQQAQFLLDFCFAKGNDGPEDGGQGDGGGPSGATMTPVMISFTLSKLVTDDDGQAQVVTVRFEVPLLTIIPISSLAVESVTLSYTLQVTSHTVRRTEPLLPGTDEKPDESVELSARISHEKPEANAPNSRTTSAHSTLAVNIKAGQLPLPTGLTAMLDLYSKAMCPIETTTTKVSQIAGANDVDSTTDTVS